jgi:hypothetical protein
MPVECDRLGSEWRQRVHGGTELVAQPVLGVGFAGHAESRERAVVVHAEQYPSAAAVRECGDRGADAGFGQAPLSLCDRLAGLD